MSDLVKYLRSHQAKENEELIKIKGKDGGTTSANSEVCFSEKDRFPKARKPKQ